MCVGNGSWAGQFVDLLVACYLVFLAAFKYFSKPYSKIRIIEQLHKDFLVNSKTSCVMCHLVVVLRLIQTRLLLNE